MIFKFIQFSHYNKKKEKYKQNKWTTGIETEVEVEKNSDTENVKDNDQEAQEVVIITVKINIDMDQNSHITNNQKLNKVENNNKNHYSKLKSFVLKIYHQIMQVSWREKWLILQFLSEQVFLIKYKLKTI